MFLLFCSFLVGGVGVLSFCYSASPLFFSTRNFRELNYISNTVHRDIHSAAQKHAIRLAGRMNLRIRRFWVRKEKNAVKIGRSRRHCPKEKKDNSQNWSTAAAGGILYQRNNCGEIYNNYTTSSSVYTHTLMLLPPSFSPGPTPQMRRRKSTVTQPNNNTWRYYYCPIAYIITTSFAGYY